MPIHKVKDGYKLHVERKGVPRIRRNFATLKAAEEFERDYLYQYLGIIKVSVPTIGSFVPGVNPIEDNRTLLELVDVWYRYHGVNLADGKRRKAMLEAMFTRLGHKTASTLSPQQFLDYRYECMYLDVKPVCAKTFNNRHVYLAAMYRTLKKLKVINYPCPIADVALVKIQERQLTYLNDAQIERLFDLLANCRNRDVWWVAQVCIRTGARWGEAESLKRKQLHNSKVTFEITKSKRVRTVPLDAGFYALLVDKARTKNPEEAIFKIGYKSFERVLGRSDLTLPKGQLTHILRHTFASHFVMNGGNILTLRDILGHADIKQTMRYAHLAPNFLNDAVTLGPMAKSNVTREIPQSLFTPSSPQQLALSH
jgi:integrase